MPVVERVKWSRGQSSEFEQWFHRELTNTIGDRSALETKWKDEIVRWRAKQPDSARDFPWPGASNLIVPITAMHTDPVYADLMQTFHAGKDFWHVTPKRPDRVDHANALREALSHVDRDFLSLRDVNKVALLHTIVLGTGIYKHTWLDEARLVRDYNEVGEIQSVLKRKSQPAIQHVPLHYFYIPADAWNIDPDAPVGGARWVAQRFLLTGSQLRAKTNGDPDVIPVYDKQATDLVLAHEAGHTEREAGTTNTDSIDAKIRSEDSYQPWKDDKIELFEVWARFDVDNDGVDEDVVVVWHQDTQTILRATHNPFLHGRRPFEAQRYLQGFGFYGIGSAEADEWSQETVTKLWNAQIDNVLVANTKMFSVPEGSDVEPGEALYPGKIWFTPPGEQIREMPMGDIHQSLPQIIGMIMQMAEQRTGVSEIRQGDISGLPSRTPATSLLSILREGNKKFDEIMATMRVPFGRMGLRVLQNLSQWSREDPQRWTNYFTQTLGPRDASLVMEVLEGPVTTMGEAFGVDVAAISSISNKEADKQNFIALLQTTSQMGGQLIQLSQLAEQFAGTQTGQVAAAMYNGGVELLTRLLERFDIQNIDTYLPPVTPAPIVPGTAPVGVEGQQGGIEPQFGQLGGFFGASPFAQGPRQVGELVGLGGG